MIAPESIDVIEAATACKSCLSQHCDVLLVRPLWHTPTVVRRYPEPPAPFQFVAPDDDGN